MYTSITGLRNHQAMLDTVGNNIANVNTYGFKGSTTAFKTLLSQTMQGAGAPSPTLGGTTFQQVGLGMTIDSISQNFTLGALQTTGLNTDLAIQGDGFFTVSDDAAGIASGAPDLSYTRAGNFKFDANGTLVTSDGNYVLGWVDNNPATVPNTLANFEYVPNGATPDALSVIQLPSSQYSDVLIGQDGTVTGIFNDPTAPADPRTGLRVIVGMISMSRVSNPSGLQQVGNNRWKESLNSGVPVIDASGNSGLGALSVGYLEMSNVDLATEFTEMIKAQRGFQANSRVITTSDEILQELVNLKR
jgi:flagellar hook protein FlgE